MSKTSKEAADFPIAKAQAGEVINPGAERLSSAPLGSHDGAVSTAVVLVNDIDEQARSASAMWRLAAIVESSEDAIISKDLNGVITSWNRGAQRLFGYTAEEAIGKSVTILIPPDRLHEEPHILGRIRKGERIEHYETVRRSKDGTLLDISLTVSPVVDEQNRIVGISKIARDITARKRAEDRLDLLAKVSDLVSTIHDSNQLSHAVAVVVGQHLKVRRCLFNETDVAQDLEIVHEDYCDGVPSVRGVHKLSEYSAITSAEMCEGKTVVNCDSQADPRTASDYERLYERTGERAYVAVPLMRDGHWVASLWASDDRPRQWRNEEVALLRTVAERTWTVIERIRIDTALRESEERLRLATEAADMYAWELDLTADLAQRSHYAEKILGFAPPENFSGGISLVHPEDRDKVNRVFDEAVESGREFQIECRVLNPETQQEVWVLTAGRVATALESKPGRLVGVTQNITKRKLSEAERDRLLKSEQEARDAAEKANEVKDVFLATLSHELRNPLNVILGYSELLLRMPEVNNSSALRQISEALRRNAQAQSQLINDLLDLSRLQTSKVSLNREAISLPAIVENAIETVREEAATKGITISVTAPESLFFVDGDRLRLQQITWNLLNNAVKFTPAGGSVQVSTKLDSENAVLSVTDTGEGIDPEFLPCVFEMFRQADGSNRRKHGGMGIGLALVRQLVQLHGGSVSAESEGPGRGSRFVVSLPLSRETQAFKTSTSSPLVYGLAKTALLIVDDSVDTVRMLEQLLASEGADVDTATSATEALQMVTEKEFDVILSDISMPEMDGFEFLTRLREIPGCEQVPVVAITGCGRREDVDRARAAGFYSHLTKPLVLEDLAKTLNDVSKSKFGDLASLETNYGIHLPPAD
jgi:PAS domain S-box-containing protein